MFGECRWVLSPPTSQLCWALLSSFPYLAAMVWPISLLPRLNFLHPVGACSEQLLESSFKNSNQIPCLKPHVVTPSCESTGITTDCGTIIDRKTLEFTKKGSPHPETKEKPQWDGRRGAITIKSNPITTGWVTHKLENTYTTEVHPLEWRFWAPRQASQPGSLATGGGIPRESDFEGYRDLIGGLRQDWGKQRLHSWRAHTK